MPGAVAEGLRRLLVGFPGRRHPELLGGVLVAIALVALLVKAWSLNAAAVVVFPAGVIVVLGGSVYHARRAKR